MKIKKVIRFGLALFGACFVLFVGCVYLHLEFGAITPNGLAAILVHDDKAGFRAIKVARFHGPKMVEPLKRESKNFEKLQRRNASWIAEVLAASDSQENTRVCRELAERTKLRQRLVGLNCLARLGRLPSSISPESYLTERIENLEKSTLRFSDPDMILAIDIVTYSKDKRAWPYLSLLLDSPQKDYLFRRSLCQAVKAIGKPFPQAHEAHCQKVLAQ